MHACYVPNELRTHATLFDPLVSTVAVAGARLLTDLDARWIGCEPADVQRIYFANHTSHMDFVLLWSALPPLLREKTRPVAAADYWDRGLVRAYVIHQVFRAVVIDRNCSGQAANPIEPLIEALDHRESLILFPEGTRGSREGLQPFKCGIFHLAKARPQVEIVPVWIDNAYRIMPKGTAVPIPLRCSVTFGWPIHLPADEPKEVFVSRLRTTLIGLSKQ